jgi:hypothetical protein
MEVRFQCIISDLTVWEGAKRTTTTKFKEWLHEIEIPISGSHDENIDCPVCKKTLKISIKSKQNAKKSQLFGTLIPFTIAALLIYNYRELGYAALIFGAFSSVVGIVSLFLIFTKKASSNDLVHVYLDEKNIQSHKVAP